VGKFYHSDEVFLDANTSAKSTTPLLRVRNTMTDSNKPTWDRLPLFTVDSAGG